MKRLTIIIQLFLIGVASFAGNWEKKYITDEFGDIDYSKPIYYLQVNPVGGYGACVSFYYLNGIFAVDFIDAHVFLDDVVSMTVKSSSGQVSKLEFEEISHEPTQYGLSHTSSQIMQRLLEEGNFSMSVKTPVPFHYGETHNHIFKIENEGKGLSVMIGKSQASSKSGKLTFKGKIGDKYDFTMVIDQPESVFDNGGDITGVYWYGNGSNGKMKVKGTVDFLGRIEIEEYDPAGKKCRDWFLNLVTDDTTGYKLGLDGIIMNDNEQTFNVSATQQ